MTEPLCPPPPLTQRRHYLKGLAAMGLLGGAGLSGLIQDVLAAGNAPVSPGLRQINGQVSVNGRPAREGQTLQTGDRVVTGKQSSAIYVIGQNAYLQRAESTVGFDPAAGPPGAAGSVASVMRVISGKILSVFGKGEQRIETATATIGIRGTGCYIESGDSKVYFCLCYGEALLTPHADPAHSETIVTRHHDHPLYIHHDSAMPMMVPAHVINHSDDELILLENLVGRWPPFYGQGGYSY